MPLPTKATFARASAGAQVSLTSRGGLAEPMPTPRMPAAAEVGELVGAEDLDLHLGLRPRPARSWPSASTPSANSSGVRSFGGVFTQSRARCTTSATVLAVSIAAIASWRRAASLSTETSATSASSERDLYCLKE